MTSTAAPAQPPSSNVGFHRYADRAETICKRSVRETGALGSRLPEVLSQSSSPQVGITNGLVKPGIEILSREANSLRNLGPPPSSQTLETFLGLFDPIVELARQRVQAGASNEPERARNLEVIIAELEDEQSAAALKLGLNACGVQFTRALGGSG